MIQTLIGIYSANFATVKVYYIKLHDGDAPSAIQSSFVKAFQLTSQKQYSKIKLILSSKGLIDSPPNFLSEGLDKILNGKGEQIVKSLEKNRRLSIAVNDKSRISIELLLLNNIKSDFSNEDAVTIFMWSDQNTFKQIVSSFFKCVLI